MKISKLNGLFLLVFFAQACSSGKIIAPTGEYSGVIPCADCPGIDYTLKLNEDYTYAESLNYQERDSPTLNNTGTYKVKNDTLIYLKSKPDNSGMQLFRLKNDQLIMLDIYGKPIQSSFADAYILRKDYQNWVTEQINGQWELQSINQKEIETEASSPNIEFILKDKNFRGFAGCNRINGKVEQVGNTLQFGMAMSTKMACPQLKLESQFLRLITNRSWTFSVTKDQLQLSDTKETITFIRAN